MLLDFRRSIMEKNPGMSSITFIMTHKKTFVLCFMMLTQKYLPIFTLKNTVKVRPRIPLWWVNKSSRINHIVFINQRERNTLNHILNISVETRRPPVPSPRRQSINRSVQLYSKKQRLSSWCYRGLYGDVREKYRTSGRVPTSFSPATALISLLLSRGFRSAQTST